MVASQQRGEAFDLAKGGLFGLLLGLPSGALSIERGALLLKRGAFLLERSACLLQRLLEGAPFAFDGTLFA